MKYSNIYEGFDSIIEPFAEKSSNSHTKQTHTHIFDHGNNTRNSNNNYNNHNDIISQPYKKYNKRKFQKSNPKKIIIKPNNHKPNGNPPPPVELPSNVSSNNWKPWWNKNKYYYGDRDYYFTHGYPLWWLDYYYPELNDIYINDYIVPSVYYQPIEYQYQNDYDYQNGNSYQNENQELINKIQEQNNLTLPVVLMIGVLFLLVILIIIFFLKNNSL